MADAFATFDATVRDAGPSLGFVLGSGMGGVPGGFAETCGLDFADVPGLAGSSVVGHSGRIALGERGGRPILLFRGRLHFYEGHPWERVQRPVELAASWGVRHLILTNAAGGIRDDLGPGDLMALENHFGWLHSNAWKGPAESSPYSNRLIDLCAAADGAMKRGNYGGVTGPCYETPAEIHALRAAGADAVGMSTVREAEAARRLGMEVAAISLITNKAAGITGLPLDHAEVIAVARTQERRLSQLIDALCRTI